MSLLRDSDGPLVRSTTDLAVDLIRAAIFDGRLAPGERLTEGRLASDLGISRTPVRGALLILQTEGLIESSPYRGSCVKLHNPADLDDLYRLRSILEGYAAARAAERISEESIGRLAESCERLAALDPLDDLKELVDENLLFHTIILEAAESERLTAMVKKVVEVPLVYKAYIWNSSSQLALSEQAHRRLTEAFVARDAVTAEALMRDHIDAAREVLLAEFESRVTAEALVER